MEYSKYSSYGPPLDDSDDSDSSFYDGFHFGTSLPKNKCKEPEDKNLHNAIILGDLEQARAEIAALKVKVDDMIYGGFTMLLLACSSGQFKVCEYLVVELKANVNKHADSITPLIMACENKQGDPHEIEKIVVLLLSHGAVVNMSNKYGTMPLMFACQNNYLSIARLLCEEANINAADNQGCTAIFYAIEKNNVEVVKLLIEKGADVTLANMNGFSPRQVAELNSFYSILELLPGEELPYMVPPELVSYNSLRDYIPRIFPKSDCPEYFQELYTILQALNMHNVAEYFVNTSLSDFLVMDDQKLRKIGIAIPIYRQKILKGLLDFHLHHWSTRKMLRVKKYQNENLYDILLVIGNTLQHLAIIQASLRYVRQNQKNGRLGQVSEAQLADFRNALMAYRDDGAKLSSSIKYLASFSPETHILYINYDKVQAKRKHQKIVRFFKYTTVLVGISVYVGFYWDRIWPLLAHA